MPSLLVRHATLLVSMDDADSCWTDGGLYVEDNLIRQIRPTDELPAQADRVIDARDMVILPGLVNTHHHFYLTLTRNLPAVPDVTPRKSEFREALRHLARRDRLPNRVQHREGLVQQADSRCGRSSPG